MPHGEGNPGEQRPRVQRGKWFLRCCKLTPFIVLFSLASIASIVQTVSSSKALKKENTYLEITEDNKNIHTFTVAALCGGAAMLAATVFGISIMITVCLQCGEEEKGKGKCRELLLGALVLLSFVFLLAGMGLSFNATGYDLLHFKARDDFETKFKRGALQSLHNYNSTHQVWDKFQEENKCCGVDTWEDYRKVFFANIVPASCCNSSKINDTQCENIRRDVNPSDVYTDHFIYYQGCSAVVYNKVGRLFQIMYWSSTAAGITAGTCILCLGVALISICIQVKFSGNDYDSL